MICIYCNYVDNHFFSCLSQKFVIEGHCDKGSGTKIPGANLKQIEP